jgi:TRAP-type C4-dicarboxylate transport system permease small subunit
MSRIDKWLDRPIDLTIWVSCIICFAMMAHVSADVFARVVFNAPLGATTEIVAGYYMVVVAFLPLAWIARDDAHIIVELFTRGLTGRRLLRLTTCVTVLTIVYIGVFTWQTAVSAIHQTEIGEQFRESAVGFVPAWPSRWMLPISGFLMTVFLILRTIRDARRILRGNGDAA